MHDGVLGLVVVTERVAADAGAQRLDDRALRRDDERGVVPVCELPIGAGVAKSLAELDETAEELAAVREDEVAGPRVRHARARQNVLEGRDQLAARLGASSAGGSFKL